MISIQKLSSDRLKEVSTFKVEGKLFAFKKIDGEKVKLLEGLNNQVFWLCKKDD